MAFDPLSLGSSLALLDDLTALYEAHPEQVDPSWREVLGDGAVRPRTPTAAPSFAPAGATASAWPLVNAFRTQGHFAATLDPLGLLENPLIVELLPSTWGLDPTAVVDGHGVGGLPAKATVAAIERHLHHVYAGSVGLEFMHISSAPKRAWLAEQMEGRLATPHPRETRTAMLEDLIHAEQFERFCHVKYPGTKRFSLEGSEPLIPLLDLVLAHSARLGALEAVLGMSHRGRLTALEATLRRPAREVFAQFEDVEPEKALGGGDVKYHMGYSADRTDRAGKTMHVALAFNPSHLEAVDPVVLGRVRAKQVRQGDGDRRKVIGVLVHGDAAFAGQGLVAETLQFMALPGYRTGGTVHVIVNNQIGFTSSPAEQRSTPYCTDIAKMIECPIWHVNGEDLDAVAHVAAIALEYRARFASDVIIDLYGYRKYGHNENDEPSFTQPVMYQRIQGKASPVDVYAHRLIEEGAVTAAEVVRLTTARVAALSTELEAAKAMTQRPETPETAITWRKYVGGLCAAPDDVDTRVPRELLGTLAARLCAVPAGFTPHPKIVRLLEQRAQMGRGERPLDWGMAELLAYASLLVQGTNVRLTGQDCGRGTFSHRHAILADVNDGHEHLALASLLPGQAQVGIYDSPLSEAGVLGFEFGFSLDAPDALVLWEAQFGDFANGAQVIIDQFILATEDKWRRLSGLTLLLPHGYEGQGPEHSSARLERFLQGCAEHNIAVSQPTTPAQIFHLLRRQAVRRVRKPLVVMTPKSLLRLPAASSRLGDLEGGAYERILADREVEPGQVTRALFCSGRVYYDLAEERARRKDPTVAIIRIEQLYPWWPELVAASVAPYASLREILWVQDEPANMGAATYAVPRLEPLCHARGVGLDVVSRAESASPATGSHKAHVLEQEQLLREAFDRR